ncbi:MAG: hypothetical protein M1831_005530 [Alyxoria varia]|nr:MAG: hypothetical protein M1831_005530 [Alyxoria varia]
MTTDFLAGYASGCASIIVGNPLDLLKVRLQSQSQSLPLPPSPSPTAAHIAQASPARHVFYSSTAAAATRGGTAITAAAASPARLLNIFKPEKGASLRTLLAGLPGPLLTYGFLNAVLFSSYTHSLAFLQSRRDQTPASSLLHHNNTNNTTTASDRTASTSFYSSPTLSAHFLSGCIAGLATLPISNPTELVKCRVQAFLTAPSSTKPTTSTTSYKTTRDIYAHQGVRGFFHGATITAVRDSLGYGFYFAGYEVSKRFYDVCISLTAADGSSKDSSSGGAHAHDAHQRGEKEKGKEKGEQTDSEEEEDAAKILLCGGVAGVITWASIYPLDVVKTRVQTQRGDIKTQRGALAMARSMYREEQGGLKIFTRGMGLCCARAFVVNAAQWFVYEWCMKVLG